MFMSDLMDLID